MKTHRGVLAAQLICLILLSASANAQERESRPLAGFDAVAIGGGIDLFLRQGTGFVVEVAAGDEDPAEIVTEVRGKTLEIHRKSSFKFFGWSGDLGPVYVTLPALVSLTASGGSDVTTEGTFTGDNLAIVASGGSDVVIDVSAGTVDVQASGGSDLTLTGSARSASVQSSGGSDLNARGFTADEAQVQSSGGSDLSIAVREKIVGDASGGSDITYTGQPTSVNVNTSGGSEVNHR